MSLPKNTIAWAAILAFALAFLLAGAIYYSPLTPETYTAEKASPQPAQTPSPTPFSALPSTPTQAPPTPAPAVISTSSISILPVLFAIAAVAVGVVAVRLLFSEKGLNQEGQ